VHVGDQLHLLTRGKLEPDRLTLTDLVPVGDTLDRMAGSLDSLFEMLQVVGMLDLERKAVEPDPCVVANGQAMMVPLIPALEEDAVLGALGDLEPHHLGVVRRSQLEVGDRDVDMTQPEDPHRDDHMAPVTPGVQVSRIAGCDGSWPTL